MKLPVIPVDKANHFIYGLVIGSIPLIFSEFLAPFTVAYAVLLPALVGALKEFFDSKHPDEHTADFADFIATIAGSMFIVGFYSLVV